MYATKLHQIVTKRDVTKNKDNVLFYYVHLYVLCALIFKIVITEDWVLLISLEYWSFNYLNTNLFKH